MAQAVPSPWKLYVAENGSDTPDEIYRAVGHALTVWGRLEQAVALSFGHLVGTQNIAALRAVGMIESAATRLWVVREAFRSMEPGAQADFPMFEESLKEIEKAAEIRNAIAHGTQIEFQFRDQSVKNFLVPMLQSARKTKNPNLMDVSTMASAREPKEVLGHLYVFALNANDIDRFRDGFNRLKEQIEACGFEPMMRVFHTKS